MGFLVEVFRCQAKELKLLKSSSCSDVTANNSGYTFSEDTAHGGRMKKAQTLRSRVGKGRNHSNCCIWQQLKLIRTARTHTKGARGKLASNVR